MLKRFSSVAAISAEEERLTLEIQDVNEKLSYLYPQVEVSLKHINSVRGPSPSVLRQKAAIDRKILALETRLVLLNIDHRNIVARLERAAAEGLVLA